jgi:flagellar protein FlaJ
MPDQKDHRSRFALENPQSLAYSLIGERTDQIILIFKDLDVNLRRSGIKISFKAYVSLTVLSAFILSFSALATVPIIMMIVFHVPLLLAVLFGIGADLFSIALTIVSFYSYPIYRADKLKRELEDELPFTTGYMAILTSAGVSPEKMFQSLSNMRVPLAISSEAKDIVRNVNLFGSDIISALEKVSSTTPSERFREMMEGFIATTNSGGNLAAYLREKSRQCMKLKRISLKRFSDTLSVLSEFYVTLLITGPLILVIMLAVMTMLGGGSLGILSPNLLLNLLTYVGIPVGSLIFIIIIDAVSPKW